MTPDRRKLIVASAFIVPAMFLCLFFSFLAGPHRDAFRIALFILILMQSGINIRANFRKPQPDTLTRLFPEPAVTTTERR